MPPLVDLDDHGFRWHQVGDTLVIRRGLTFRSILWPLLAGFVMLGIGVSELRDGAFWAGGFMVFATVLPAALLWIRMVHRFELQLSPDGLAWRQTKPRAFEGRWHGRELDGVRLVVGTAMSGLWRNRWILVDVRRNGGWTRLASGLNRRRGERLARAISDTRVWPLVVHEEEKDGELPR